MKPFWILGTSTWISTGFGFSNRRLARNNTFLCTVCALIFPLSAPAAAQQLGKSPRIGFLAAVSPTALLDRTDAFRRGLRELGYVEGKNIVIEYRYAEGKLDRLPALAAELVRLKVDVIVTAGPPATVPPRKLVLGIPLSWRRIAIRLETVLLPALHDLAGTLLDYQPFPQN